MFDQKIAHFHFIRLWHQSQWVDVSVDDQLPTIAHRYPDSEVVHLLKNAKAKQGDYWAPLLEKAYAKVHGSYKAIHGGQISQAMMGVSGMLFSVVVRIP